MHPKYVCHKPSTCPDCANLYLMQETKRQDDRSRLRATSPVASALADAFSKAIVLKGKDGKPLNATAKAAKLRKADIAPELAHLWLNS